MCPRSKSLANYGIGDAIRLNLRPDTIRENCRKLGFYFRGQDQYWLLAERAEQGPQPYPLDFTPQLACGHFAHFDDLGIPLQRSRDGLSYVHNYTMICGFALAHWNLHLRSGRPEHLKKVLAVADYITRTADRSSGMVCLRTERSGQGHVGELSGMYQGEAMSVLCRAWQASGRREYLETAIGCAEIYEVPVSKGGILGQFEGANVPWFEEYPSEPQTHVLNGMVFAIWGLRDVALLTGYRHLEELWRDGVERILIALPSFDSGFWSWYSIAETGKPYIASMMYHNLHIAQLTALWQQTGRPDFGQWAERWRSYSGRQICRARAAFDMARAKWRMARGGRRKFYQQLNTTAAPKRDISP